MSRLSNQIYRVANLDITIFLTKPKTERKLPNKQGRASRRPNKEDSKITVDLNTQRMQQ